MRIIKKLTEKCIKKNNNKDKTSNTDMENKEMLLNKKLKSENIIKLININGQSEYFYMEYTPTTILLILQTGRKDIECLFKQLTGRDAGKIYKVMYPANNTFNSDGFFLMYEGYPRYLTIGIRGFNEKMMDVLANNEIENNFGAKITFKDLLELNKIENNNEY